MAGMLSKIVRNFQNFLTGSPYTAKELSWDYRMLGEEKLASAPAAVNFPIFLPYYDPHQSVFETTAMRLSYRRMLADPNVKSALLNQILSVCALDIHFMPFDKKNARYKEMASFVEWVFKRRVHKNIPGLVWNIFHGGLVDGYSVNEKIWGLQTQGLWKNKIVLKELKPKDVNQHLVLNIDAYNNITSVQGLQYNQGEHFPPHYFTIYSYLPLYNNPTGMSALRAAYSRYWMLDTVLKLRAMGAEKRSFPIIVGEFNDPTKQSTLERVLAKVKTRNWMAVPLDTKIRALDIAGAADDYFKSFCSDLREEIMQSIQGATLQAMAGRIGQIRGDTSIHKNTADVWKWFLSSEFVALLNDEERGLIPELINYNYSNVAGYPLATFEGVDEAELERSLRIDRGLNQMGFIQSVDSIAERYGREPAEPGEQQLNPPIWNAPSDPTGMGGSGEPTSTSVTPPESKDGTPNGNGTGGTGKIVSLLSPQFQYAEKSHQRILPAPTADDPVEEIFDLDRAAKTERQDDITGEAGKTAHFNPEEWLPKEGLKGGNYWVNTRTGAILHDKTYQELVQKDRTRPMAPFKIKDEALPNLQQFIKEIGMMDLKDLQSIKSQLDPIVEQNEELKKKVDQVLNMLRN